MYDNDVLSKKKLVMSFERKLCKPSSNACSKNNIFARREEKETGLSIDSNNLYTSER